MGRFATSFLKPLQMPIPIARRILMLVMEWRYILACEFGLTLSWLPYIDCQQLGLRGPILTRQDTWTQNAKHERASLPYCKTSINATQKDAPRATHKRTRCINNNEVRVARNKEFGDQETRKSTAQIPGSRPEHPLGPNHCQPVYASAYILSTCSLSFYLPGPDL